ncbi:MAG: DNA-formamidopyrimidine glycosylase, partial [Deltaproteobacteria bacterium]|nr:DNA-formamidopyrimidine glycosylase [Deltaproteobacteria bacterium]
MPELPEVQTVVNDLIAAGLIGAQITGARVFWPRSIAIPAARTFCKQVSGQTITMISRRAKYIIIELAGGKTLLIHLRMSGRLNIAAPDKQRGKHEHIILRFNDQRELRFHDTRKFGRIFLLGNPATVLDKLGPEPLDKAFTLRVFTALLRPRKRLLKPLLLDQNIIAGLGNIYVDEALWEARLHPCRIAASLTPAETKALHRAIPRVLKRGLKNLGTSLGTGKANFYSVAGRSGRNRDQL